MNWKRLGVIVWHGFSATVIAAAVTVGTYQQTPQGWQWSIFITGLLVAFVRGVKSYLQEPE